MSKTTKVNQGSIDSSLVQEFEDGRSFNPNAVRKITQQWVDAHMKDKESLFTDATTVSIFCGTWNVNSKKLEGGLEPWLLPQGEGFADIYAIGFQEIVDLNAMNVALDGSKTLSRAAYWHDHIMDCLQKNPQGVRYILVMQKTLVGVLLSVYASERMAGNIKDVRGTTAGVGIMGMMGNKGGASVRMSIYDSSVCFVCAHLAAHRDNIAGRNSDYKNIIERTVFVADTSATTIVTDDDIVTESSHAVEEQVIRPRHGAEKTKNVDLTILDHELVFWIGDLNYRIDEKLPTEEVFELIERGNISYLRDLDQLNIERGKGAVFQSFDEGLLTFLPTYKYQPGTNEYEQRAEKKLRAPAWCDRVLWRNTNLPETVRLQNYNRAELLPSDHKPVRALFSCDLRQVNTLKEEQVYRSLMSKLGEVSRSTELPVVQVVGLSIDLPSVRYEVVSPSVVRVSNVGVALAHWHFINKLEDTKIARRWISVNQASGMLLPNESTDIIISICVDKKTAQALNLGREILEDLLILRVENCKDYYVAVKAKYERSSYGMSLEELCYTTQPVRETVLPGLAAGDEGLLAIATTPEASTISQPPKSPRLGVPKELWRLVDALWTGGALRERDLFASANVNPAEVAAVRESLDCGVELPVCTPHTIAEALVSFLAALPKPLLPPELYPSAAVDPPSMRSFCRRFLQTLPPLNYNVFVYLVSFMREVLVESDFNRTSPARLSAVLVQCLTPSITDPDISKEERVRREGRQQDMRAVLEFLLTTTAL